MQLLNRIEMLNITKYTKSPCQDVLRDHPKGNAVMLYRNFPDSLPVTRTRGIAFSQLVRPAIACCAFVLRTC